MAHAMRSWLHLPPMAGGTAPLWAGVLGAPAAWLVQMQSMYSFSTWSCWHHTKALLFTFNVVLLLTAIGGGLLSLTYWRGRKSFPDRELRVMFLSGLGIVSSIMYSLLIVSQGIAVIMLDPCAT